MQEKYNPKEIESKRQKIWRESGIYKTKDLADKPKFYALDMFPYPSGAGLHVGHTKGYTATDAVSRMKMMQGFNVLHPMGWDAFGLPAENYAIKNKIHPRASTEKNIAVFKEQLEKIGFTYDWSREVDTTDPEFYKWTQWIFLKMFEKGLAYESDEPVNWCPSCKTVLANEDLEGGLCERCGTQVVQKKMKQWVLKMTDYADRLLNDLDKKDMDWEELIKEQQRNWIGRSEGATVKFQITNDKLQTNLKDQSTNSKQFIEVFTTRVDTIFSGTYLILAPDNSFVEKITTEEQKKEVEQYIKQTSEKTEIERMSVQKDKTGVFTGSFVINPATGDKMQIWISDFVLANYGTGAVFADAHDERDFEMAKKFNIPLKVSVRPSGDELWQKVKNLEVCYSEEGVLVNSGDFDGLASAEARPKITKWLENRGLGSNKVNYKMRDWVFSRQRYWGEPIPIIHCAKCGAVGVPEKDLPVALPEVESYEPTGTGESPLAKISEWVNTKCPKCGGAARRETNTMPQWAGSSWYYLRFIDPKNSNELVSKEKEKYWMNVDLYVGGAEHATRHLLYARFWHKFLYDIGVVSTEEPFKKLFHVGLILAEDGRKMSKRWGNVINPDDIIAEFGADSFRLYEMFMGPFSQSVSWSTKGVVGMRRFLERAWGLQSRIMNHESRIKDLKLERLAHKTIKKVGEDIENFKFNTAISALMILANEMEKSARGGSAAGGKDLSKEYFEKFLILLSPFTPHIAEELWSEIGNKESIFLSRWPEYNKDLIKEDEIEMLLQVNGKLRDKIKAPADISEEEAKKLAFESEKIKKEISGKEIKKVIFVKGRLINLVITL